MVRPAALAFLVLALAPAAASADTLSDLSVELAPIDDARGLYLGKDGNNNTGVLTLSGRHLTVLADDANAIGAIVYNNAPNESAVLHLRDSVIAGTDHPLVRTAVGGSASIDTDYSDYPAVLPADSSGAGTLTEDHHLTAAPGLDAGGHPDAGSPLIDAGTPGALDAGERATDAGGRPRFVAGSGCDARRDIGAFEFQPMTLTAVAGAPATAKAGDAVTYSAAGSCDPDPLVARRHRLADVLAVAEAHPEAGGRARHDEALAPRLTATPTDPAGNRGKTVRIRFTIRKRA